MDKSKLAEAARTALKNTEATNGKAARATREQHSAALAAAKVAVREADERHEIAQRAVVTAREESQAAGYYTLALMRATVRLRETRADAKIARIDREAARLEVARVIASEESDEWAEFAQNLDLDVNPWTDIED